ncbi:CaiB/BaiF CoA transferase family protein [Hydrogenophaga laconesensis]|uniref:Crotonobetainyl-CoA:carnitine CoA-transferase CaiB-like acyl-CoA transferase n=1 Tax=Hydrogenophaga laconesensis TaxID=1805971 RepID=A0ABU1VJU1_9BURK|nr:CaiB/BaiF CoA-transferase family protein [Hydrogenophaga laconesensis]MDR7097595.1 crotonobetainyl-CoA:carnitine CoA-transferase CaiB-like acyl-CoA transferase [Hydrogenophaga laconesensis]
MSLLSGIRVLELGRVPPLEVPGMMLADMGADVIKVESPSSVILSENEEQVARRSYTNRNKRSVFIDLKTEEGVLALKRLAQNSDVLVEGFRPGVLDRLGVGYDALRQVNSRLVYCSMSGYGQTGPDRLKPAHDLNFLARSGVLDLVKSHGDEVSIPLNLVADYGGASLHAALAIMFALFARERGLPGQYIDISYLDCTLALLASTPNLRQLVTKGHTPRAEEGVFCGGYPYYSVYTTRDEERLAVACSEPHLWVNFCDVIGHPELKAFARHEEHYRRSPSDEEAVAKAKVSQRLRERDARDWLEVFDGANVCVSHVQTIDQVLADPHLSSRGMINDHGGRVQFGSPFRLSLLSPCDDRPAPIPGEHTAEVLHSAR